MSNQGSWSCLSVQEFFSLCNWQGLVEAGGREEQERQGKQGEKEFLSWECLSVQEFFSLCSWQGQVEIAESGTPILLSQTDWQCLSVQEFFSLCNWQGQPQNSSRQNAPSSHLQEQVTQFFQFIPWEGNPEIGSIPVSPIPEPYFSELVKTTFTDLSDLF